MEITEEIVNPNEVELPLVLYKYRQWDNHLHRTLLLQRQVYMAAPSTFEDKNEFRNPKRYDLMTDEEVYNLYLNHSLINNPHYTHEQHHNHAVGGVSRQVFKDLGYLKAHQAQTFKEYDKRVGVLCLTSQRDSSRMWDYYTAKGNGICVGLDYNMLVESIRPHGGGGPVIYCDELPLIPGTDDYTEERMKRTFFKVRKWEFEQEYRTVTFKSNPLQRSDRVVSLPPNSIKEVIIGWAMAPREINNLMKLCKRCDVQAELFQAYRGNPIEIKRI